MCLNVYYDAYGNIVPRPLTLEEILAKVLSVSIMILFISSAIYSIYLVLKGGYGLLVTKDRTNYPKHKWNIKKGVLIFIITFGIWSIINLISSFLSVDTLCL
jgi:hypothetical protein